MGFESANPYHVEKKSLQEQNKSSRPSQEKEVSMDRRGFLKLGLGALAAFALAKELKIAEKLSDVLEKENGGATADKTERIIETESLEENPRKKEIKEVRMEINGEVASVREILSYSTPGKFEFTQETHEKIKNYWKDQYNKDAGLRKRIGGALERMDPWEEELKKIFREKGLPEKFAYLAIPESFFDPDAVSEANAVGPYQFTGGTALLYKLKMDGKTDERKDPIKSGRAAAECLRDNYNRCRDFRISLSGYNGKYAWDYLKNAYANGNDIAFKYLLKHQANSANFLREKAKNICKIHKVKKGDGLLKIARDYNLPIKELCAFNGITEKSVIRKGQKIKIPIPEKLKKEKYEDDIISLRESLEYPAKCEAFFEIIEKIKSA
ncbi:MAG TPA: hypothetical protein DCX32_03120 [Candidatus Moranbacteria bacterium]|nr:MAG: Glycoside hydrolase family 23 [Candidatus Moranbacteria bacterium GW2011_GWC2_45_10]KKT95040.1 MAG: Glycoside hydrolase family 23 [Parcubacteria group bacterium GW2011_GWC1_45_14]HAV11510.1 hypothetical protein [Candidatus Moranbacteria bacterium]